MRRLRLTRGRVAAAVTLVGLSLGVVFCVQAALAVLQTDVQHGIGFTKGCLPKRQLFKPSRLASSRAEPLCPMSKRGATSLQPRNQAQSDGLKGGG